MRKNTANDLTVLKNVKVTFRIQKNRENGQSITLKTDNKHPEISCQSSVQDPTASQKTRPG